MKISYIVILILFIKMTLVAQENRVFETDYTIQSKAFGDERKVTVYLPPSFYESPETKFSVTYVLDGHFDPFIDLAVKTIEYNTFMYKYTPTIVVGVHAKQRGWEFSAPIQGEEEDSNYRGGRAPELQQHFKNEVFPLIDSIYKNKVLPFKNIIGHSSGGAFVLYSLFSDEKDLFDGYIAISPGIREDDEYILDNAVAKLKMGERFQKFLYCSSGTVGETEEKFSGSIQKLDSILNEYPNHGLIWKTSKFEGMDHWTCVPPSFNSAMVELTRAFRVDEKTFHDFAMNEGLTMKDQIESFYENRQELYGFFEIPYPGYIKQIAWELMEKGKTHAALDMYDWGLKHYTDNYTLLRARAILLLRMSRKEEAYYAFEEILQKLEKTKGEIDKEKYEDRKAYLNKKLIECMKD